MRIKPIDIDLRKNNLSRAMLADSIQHNTLNVGKNSLENYFQRVAYSDDSLLASLSNSLKLHKNETRKNDTLSGRFLGLFTTAKDPEWIKIDGTRLIQIHQLADVEPPITLSASKHYFAEVNGLRTMLQSVENFTK